MMKPTTNRRSAAVRVERGTDQRTHSPTRVCALQLANLPLALGIHVVLSAVSVVGGFEMRMQERALRGSAEIVVATPWRLLDHMRFGYVDYSALDVLVLDEADRML